jgi:hypothetical protein
MSEIYKGNSPITWPCFMFGSTPIQHFISSHNVNLPPFRMTERSIELALADLYLKRYERELMVEIGATTPYYWPHRISTIIDPTDVHPLVSNKQSFLDFNLSGRPVLSISTFEHIGLPDYGLAVDEAMQHKSFSKLLNSAGDFLVTIPGGYNPKLDNLVLALASQKLFRLHLWHRKQFGNDWIYIDYKNIEAAKFEYGPFWANTLLVLHRGEDFI